MKISHLTILVAIIAVSRSEVAVIVKPDVSDYTNSFDVEADSFTEMIERNKIFVDNTLFIAECVQRDHSLYMMGPRKSAKTINLQMLKTFLEIQVDKGGNRIEPKESTSNYKLFVDGEIMAYDGTSELLETPLRISTRDDLVREHLGEYPVIYIAFGKVTGKTALEVKRSIGEAIQQVFDDHLYLRTAFENGEDYVEPYRGYLDTICEVLSESMKLENLGDYIQELCLMIYEHFHRDAVIMYDDFDAPLTNTLSVENFPTQDLLEIVAILEDLANKSFGIYGYCSKAYITVTFELYHSFFSKWDNYYERIDLNLNYTHPISRYFVFDEETVARLFDLYKIPRELRDRAHKWYKGFQPDKYNIYSVANFLNFKIIANYFKDTDFERIVPPLIHTNTEVRNTLTSFLSSCPLITSLDSVQTKISTATLYKLKPQTENVRESHKYLYENDTLFVFDLFLIRKGYLRGRILDTTNKSATRDSDLKVQFALPNLEIKTLMCSLLMSYYRHKYQFYDHSLQDAATSLLRFIHDDNSSQPSLERHLHNLYSRSSSFLEFANITEHRKVEYLLNIVVANVALKLQNLTEFQVDVIHPQQTKSSSRNDPSSKLNYVIIDKRTGQAVILQLNYNQPVAYTVKLMRDHELVRAALRDLEHLDKVKLVAVNMRRNKTVEIYSEPSVA